MDTRRITLEYMCIIIVPKVQAPCTALGKYNDISMIALAYYILIRVCIVDKEVIVYPNTNYSG